jgi:hypothetical protein
MRKINEKFKMEEKIVGDIIKSIKDKVKILDKGEKLALFLSLYGESKDRLISDLESFRVDDLKIYL